LSIAFEEGEPVEGPATPTSPGTPGGIPSLDADDYLDEATEG
jgi:hypothetical protein